MSVKDEAALWAVKAELGLSTLEQKQLTEWLSQSPRHERAFKARRGALRPMQLISDTVVPSFGMISVIVIVTVAGLRLRPDLLYVISGGVAVTTLALMTWVAWRFRD